MSKVTMTLYEAISKKKIYEDRLSKFDVRSKVFFGTYTKADPKINGLDLDQAKEAIQGNFDSFKALKNNVYTLRAAIYEANISNTVLIEELDEKPITLAEAISRFQSLDQDLRFLETIKSQRDRAMKLVDEENSSKLSGETVYREVSKMLTDSKKKSGDAEEFKAAEANYRELYTRHLFDPLNLVKDMWVDKEIERIQNLKDKFHVRMMQVDVSVILEIDLED